MLDGVVELEANEELDGDSFSTITDDEVAPVAEADDDRELDGLADSIAGVADISAEFEAEGDELPEGDSSSPISCVFDGEREDVAVADDDEYPDSLADDEAEGDAEDVTVGVVDGDTEEKGSH